MALVDQHNRQIQYLRLAVTDRCNLRCSYCMPAEGIDYLPKNKLLTYEEMLRLCGILATEGVNKIRITGGEPFLRQGLIDFLEKLSQIPTIQQIAITTNGVLTAPYLPKLKELGITKINLSLDSLDAATFQAITRRNEYAKVMDCLQQLIEQGFEVKLNAVIMQGQNEADLHRMVAFTEKNPVSVRFIEEMPFNGSGHKQGAIKWTAANMLNYIQQQYPHVQKLTSAFDSTSENYQVKGFKGTFGTIAAYTRNFCGTCNRIRLTPQGELKTCLYQAKGSNIREMLRENYSDKAIVEALQKIIYPRYANGHLAEAAGNAFTESMSSIGG
jgi:molybdenum cofactor biosynthesis protein A